VGPMRPTRTVTRPGLPSHTSASQNRALEGEVVRFAGSETAGSRVDRAATRAITRVGTTTRPENRQGAFRRNIIAAAGEGRALSLKMSLISWLPVQVTRALNNE
jgi:hypothetical protein